jgi:hypothetical protein
VFGGTWSTSPDPVDFRDFQRIDLTSTKPNMFTDPEGNVRPLARQGTRVMVTYRNFSDMERPLRGEQLESFEYVFSPKGPDGAPLRLWNRDTGEVNTDVAASWKPYDIGRTLRTRWKELAPDLAGKIHVIMGDDDTFYLEGACRLLKKDLEAMGADASVRMLPGDHRNRADESRAREHQQRHGRRLAQSPGTEIALAVNFPFMGRIADKRPTHCAFAPWSDVLRNPRLPKAPRRPSTGHRLRARNDGVDASKLDSRWCSSRWFFFGAFRGSPTTAMSSTAT